MLIPLDDQEALLALRDFERRAQPPSAGRDPARRPPDAQQARAA
jgi:hypothetical protein